MQKGDFAGLERARRALLFQQSSQDRSIGLECLFQNANPVRKFSRDLDSVQSQQFRQVHEQGGVMLAQESFVAPSRFSENDEGPRVAQAQVAQRLLA